MIIKFKLFETIDDDPEIGDYAYIKIDGTNLIGTEFNRKDIDNKIFKIINVYGRNNLYQIDIGSGLWLYRDEVLAYSKDEKELELQIQMNKYNL